MARLPLACCTALLCGACATLPPNVAREPSYALADPEGTALGQAFLPEVVAQPGKSGFMPVVAGANAYLLRAAMAGLAEHTLDLQYYIWEDDLTGRMMLHDVMRAAGRGVRVRLLLDDVHAEGETGLFSRIDAHPRIEVRLFNPFERRDARMVGWLLDGARLNHRMHNKVMIADNAIAITGGRNIGDHYFAVDALSNFRDLDLLAIGPVVQDLSSMFDLYWNSGWSYPIVTIEPNGYTEDDARRLASELRREMHRPTLPFAVDGSDDAMRERLLSRRDAFSWGRARTIFDNPMKPEGDHLDGRGVAEFLTDTFDRVQRELLIETAYFIPGGRGVDRLASLVDRGVEVIVLTNSLATNDVLAAHAG
ncbi:MAG TPA: phospholipase D-like domain-containing protein, partial [Gammaproteobacteria bacterium]